MNRKVVVLAIALLCSGRFVATGQPTARSPAVFTAAQAEAGRTAFENSCAQCHTVRGTGAMGTLGPDLTHVASRSTLAAGTFANQPELLERWIADPQSLKTGTTMPPSGLSAEGVRLLVQYLGSLQ